MVSERNDYMTQALYRHPVADLHRAERGAENGMVERNETTSGPAFGLNNQMMMLRKMDICRTRDEKKEPKTCEAESQVGNNSYKNDR